MKAIEKIWYNGSKPWWRSALWPLMWVYRLITYLRRFFYRSGIFKSHAFSVPVIVVGNITVGGTGKTPLCVAIANHFKDKAIKVGFISRGYKGSSCNWPQVVTAQSDPLQVGDEPVLLAALTKAPVVVDPNRCRAAKKLLEEFAVDVIVSDDGLQHYALKRNIEIAVIDGERRYGNQACLPLGPLREPLSRLKTVDTIVCNGIAAAQNNELSMQLELGYAYQLKNPDNQKPLSEFAGQTVHAFAAIGHPQRFFKSLRDFKISVIENSHRDHYHYHAKDFRKISDEQLIFLTEKDAVKCKPFARANMWVLPVKAKLSPEFWHSLSNIL